MEPDWAAENLQVIRTLMERSAIYRRTLAPVMLLSGLVGLAAAAAGWSLGYVSPRSFVTYWLAVSVVPLVGTFLLVRRQAFKAGEPLWSLPTRRVIQAALPCLFSGLVISGVAAVHLRSGPGQELSEAIGLRWLPVGWVILYGCAIHAAGFFMPRGIKLFGWSFIVGGCALFALGAGLPCPPAQFAYGVMALFFGALHLAYGIYLYFTEKRKNAA